MEVNMRKTNDTLERWIILSGGGGCRVVDGGVWSVIGQYTV